MDPEKGHVDGDEYNYPAHGIAEGELSADQKLQEAIELGLIKPIGEPRICICPQVTL